MRQAGAESRVLHAGTARGRVLLLEEPLSLWGGSSLTTGRVTDERHPQFGQTMSGRVLVLPAARGSSSSTSVLAEQIRRGVGPAAIILCRPDPILVIAALVVEELYDIHVPVVLVDDATRIWLGGCETVAVDASSVHVQFDVVP